MMKPIETRYAGCHFRSRLEARWAVFFDTIGIRWEYEPQGHSIDGRPYLVDFWLPRESTWAEVKPAGVDEYEGEHVDLLRGLTRETGHPSILLVGTPEARLYHRFQPGLGPNGFTCGFFRDYDGMIGVADAWWYQSVAIDPETGVKRWDYDNDRSLRKSFGRGYLAALIAARSARFEHGGITKHAVRPEVAP